MSRETPTRPKISFEVVAQRHFCCQEAPCSVEFAHDIFFLVDHRLPGRDHPSLVGEIILGDVRTAKFEVCFPDQIFGVLETHSECGRPVGDYEATLLSLTQRLSGTQSIRVCRERRALAVVLLS